MNNYYSEELNPKSIYRQDYVDSLNKFVDDELASRKAQRKLLITPSAYKDNQEFYRAEFIKMLGFPLNLKQQMPLLLKKDFVAIDGNVNIYRMQFEVIGGIKFYGMYFEQTVEPEKAPFLIGQHGAEGTPELCASIYMNSSNYNHMVRRRQAAQKY